MTGRMITDEHRANIGRRIRWETYHEGEPEVYGTIVDVTVARGGWPGYVVRWDSGAPPFWTSRVSVIPQLWRYV